MKILARTVNITPETQSFLGGNSESVIWDSIHSDLEANLLLIQENNATKLIITMDLLYIGAKITDSIIEFASEYVHEESIWISSSHTHNAPHVDHKKPKLGKIDPDYVNQIINRINNEISEMAMNLEAAETVNLRIKIARAPLTINRRKRRILSVTKNGLVINKVTMQPDRRGKTDPSIRKMEFINDHNEIIALVWHYTCHPTSFYEPNSVSSHYIGEVRKEIRFRRKSEVPVLFMQGFAGDIRPPSLRRFHENFIHNLLQGNQFRDFTKKEYNRWIKRLIKLFFSDREILHNGTFSIKKPIKKKWDSRKFVLGSATPDVVLQIMPLGPIYFVGLSCEPTISLAQDLLEISQEGQIWPCGYLEDVYGYLPSNSEMLSGGYEVEGFCESFDCVKLTGEGWSVALNEIRTYFNQNS